MEEEVLTMVCCKCSKLGICRSCTCVKSGELCDGCQPSKLGRCVNSSSVVQNVVPVSCTPTNSDNPPSCVPDTPTLLQGVSSSPDLSCCPVIPLPELPVFSVAADGVPGSCTPTSSDNCVPVTPTSSPVLSCCPLPELPVFSEVADGNFIWGDSDQGSFCQSLRDAYVEVVHWRKSLFKVPLGSSGKSFVVELARLYEAFASSSALKSVALMATIVMPILVLQLPHRKSKVKEHIACLDRRLKSWKAGDLVSLIKEGRTLQHRLPQSSSVKHDERLARSFANLMFKGKIHAALDLLANRGKGGLLRLDDRADPNDPASPSVSDVLHSKHPSGQPASVDSILPGVPLEIHPVVFDSIDARLVRSTALRGKGAAGPSGLDAYAWRRLCTAFKSVSATLCQSLANVAKHLCTSFVDPKVVSPLLACRLIALDKCPGVRPIGIGDMARRIIAKSVLVIARGDIQDAAGSLQLCAGQIAGCEAAVHSVREGFQEESTEAALLVDASNAFNSLNRLSALHNIRHLCPSMATILVNCYRAPTDLFIDGDVILSQEGITQGDPLAMPMYALATVPLIQRLTSSVKQTWYADDAAAFGRLTQLRVWWDEITRLGPGFGYYANASKTWLVTKAEFRSEAEFIFEGTDVQITCEGRPYLGAPLGCSAYIKNFVTQKVQQWSSELRMLSDICSTQPHAAYAALTHGLSSKWLFLSRTTPNISHHFQSLDAVLCSALIPNLTNRPPPNDVDLRLFALPARLGGLGIARPSIHADCDFDASLRVTAPLRDLLKSNNQMYSFAALDGQMSARADIRQERRLQATSDAESLREVLSPSLLRAMDLASERGSSSWLTALPIEEHGFCLHKGAFVDALALRYGWAPSRTPTTCECGAGFSVEHVLSCPKGGFPSIRHNELRDLTATLLTEICNDVRIEPDLQPLSSEVMLRRTANTTDGARLDVAANGFWGGRYERTFLDVRVFNPYASSNCNTPILKCFRKHEMEKKRAYEQRILEVEHATFTPLVFSASGGFGKEATTFYKRLASLLADHWDQPYSTTMSWLRCTISFCLLRSAIQCIRGARSSGGRFVKAVAPVDLIIAETNLSQA